MRNQPIDATPWEVEAARRRELIAADFGATESFADPRARSQGRIGPVGRLAALLGALTKTGDGVPGGDGVPVRPVDRSAGCKPGIGAVEPGS